MSRAASGPTGLSRSPRTGWNAKEQLCRSLWRDDWAQSGVALVKPRRIPLTHCLARPLRMGIDSKNAEVVQGEHLVPGAWGPGPGLCLGFGFGRPGPGCDVGRAVPSWKSGLLSHLVGPSWLCLLVGDGRDAGWSATRSSHLQLRSSWARCRPDETRYDNRLLAPWTRSTMSVKFRI